MLYSLLLYLWLVWQCFLHIAHQLSDKLHKISQKILNVTEHIYCVTAASSCTVKN